MSFVRENKIDLRDDILSQFTKDELLEVATDFGIDANPSDQVINVVKSIFIQLAQDGVPDSVTEIMADFLVAAEVLDEDYNQIDYIEEDDEEVLPIKLPPCFGIADDRDPNCQRCKLLDVCKAKRLDNRPPCYGLAFDGNEDDCKICLEASFCKQEMESN